MCNSATLRKENGKEDCKEQFSAALRPSFVCVLSLKQTFTERNKSGAQSGALFDQCVSQQFCARQMAKKIAKNKIYLLFVPRSFAFFEADG